MNDQDPSIKSENRLSEPETPLVARGNSPGMPGARLDSKRPARAVKIEPNRLKIVVRVAPAKSQQSEPSKPVAEAPTSPELSSATPETSEHKARTETEPQQIPARMLNEFVYCQRLFYYEFVEGVFVESADTLRGGAIHQRVDSGTGALPVAKRKSETGKPKEAQGTAADAADSASKAAETQSAEPETIHSRSVQMGSERLGVVAKMDLVESKTGKEDLLTALEVCPVDYKAGAPKEGEEANRTVGHGQNANWIAGVDSARQRLRLQRGHHLLSSHQATCPSAHYFRTGKLDSAKHCGGQTNRYRADSTTVGQFAEMCALFARAGVSAGRNPDAGRTTTA